jgi:hypothetical protein
MGDERDDDGGEHGDREAMNRPVADEVPEIGGHHRGLDRRAVVDHEDVEDRAADDQGDERRQEGAQAHVADQITVEAAEGETGQHGGDEGDPGRLLQDEKAADGGEIGEGEDRPHGEIDTAAQHDDGHARHDDRKLAELARGIAQRRRLEEAGNRGAEHGDRHDQGQERDGVVGPALGQDLADQMIGNVVVAQAQRPLAQGHRRSPLQGRAPRARRGTNRAPRRGPTCSTAGVRSAPLQRVRKLRASASPRAKSLPCCGMEVVIALQ